MKSSRPEKRTLTERQLEIARLVRSGKSSVEIGKELFIKPRTVDSHIETICDKLDVRTRVEMVVKLFGDVRAADAKQTNLPTGTTSFVGRETQVEDIVSILRDSRLVTITGVGGVGKTRTALAVGAAIPDSTVSGVWLVELAPLESGSIVGSALARVLGVRESPRQPILGTLVAHLRLRNVALIFDNCEHVIEEVAAVTREVLKTCPGVRILATSREPLHVASEEVYQLPSLRVPNANIPLVSRAAAAAYSAIRLFVERAQSANERFTLSDANAADVAEICRRLDGIPLAIEVVAARTRSMSAPIILSQLNARLPALTNPNRKAQRRHQTVTAMIDWSYDLLTAPEQRLFERLAIFSGGCDLAAVKAVCADDAGSDVQVDALLSSLVEKSLVIAAVDGDGETRYALLTMFRQYAREKLDQRGETTRIAHRHAAAYADIADRLERAHDDGSDAEWIQHAQRELDNWRSALNWTLRLGEDTLLGMRLASALRPVWMSCSIAEGRRWVQAAREFVDERTPSKIVADLDYTVAGLAYAFAELDVSLALSLDLVGRYKAIGDPFGVARAQYLAGTSLVILGRLDEGEELLASTLRTARNLGKLRLGSFALQSIAEARSMLGDLPAARAYLNEALNLYQTLGADRNAATVSGSLAEIEFRAGNTEEAIRLTMTMLGTLRSLGDTLYITKGLNNAAAYLIASNRFDAARPYAEEALELAGETEHEIDLAWSIQHLAAIAALRKLDASPDGLTVGVVGRLLGFVDARVAALGSLREFTEKQEYDRVRDALSATMPGEALEQLMADGTKLSQSEAATEARALQADLTASPDAAPCS